MEKGEGEQRREKVQVPPVAVKELAELSARKPDQWPCMGFREMEKALG